MRKLIHTATLIAAAVGALTLAAAADARSGFLHVGGATATGSAGGSVVAGQRGVAGRAHGSTTSANGSVTSASGGYFQGTSGATGWRAGTAATNPDGSLSHQGALAASCANGAVTSANNFARSAAGQWSGSSATSATSTKTGTTYNGATTIDPTTGQPVHSGGCTNGAGASVAC